MNEAFFIYYYDTFYFIFLQCQVTVNSLSDGAQLKLLAEQCGDHKKELTDISISTNKELNHLTQKLNMEIDLVDSDISVIIFILICLNIFILYLK